MIATNTDQLDIQGAILAFLQGKGADTSDITEQSSLLTYIQSMDFVELIVSIEGLIGQPLNMETADIETFTTLGGFAQWAATTAGQ